MSDSGSLPSRSGNFAAGYLVDALREEIRSLESELDSVHGSLRYRVGALVLQDLVPIGRSTVPGLIKLARFYLSKRRASASGPTGVESILLPPAALSANALVYGREPSEHGFGKKIWASADVLAILERLNVKGDPGTLLLRRAAVPILRRLERDRLAGWRVIWWPESATDTNPALDAYARAHCDECVERMDE